MWPVGVMPTQSGRSVTLSGPSLQDLRRLALKVLGEFHRAEVPLCLVHFPAHVITGRKEFCGQMCLGKQGTLPYLLESHASIIKALINPERKKPNNLL